VCVDVDGDGDVDVFVSCTNTYPQVLLVNNGSGYFVEAGGLRGVNVSLSLSTSVYGSSVGDIDNDGDVDVFVGTSGSNLLFVNNGSGFFVESGVSRGVSDGSVVSVGGVFGDVDVDGDMDLYVSNVGVGVSRLWLNNGSGYFVDVGGALDVTASGAAVFVDVDGDGDVDLPGCGLENTRVVSGVTPVRWLLGFVCWVGVGSGTKVVQLCVFVDRTTVCWWVVVLWMVGMRLWVDHTMFTLV
jgi:hypothetical protein